MLKLTGSITALATPFEASGGLDREAWHRLLAAQLSAGTAAVVVAGSTGEAAALDQGEYQTLLREAVSFIDGRIPVLAGTGQSATAATIARTRLARDCGADAALVVTPPYVRPTQAGLLAHYRAVAEQGGLPVVLYNVPTRTGCDLLPETVAELAVHPGIIGVKESVADPARLAALRPLRGDGFALLSGDDPSFVQTALDGADGVISVASNVVPGGFRRLCELARAGQADSARGLDAELLPLYRFLALEPNPIPVKALLSALGMGQGLRLPLLPLSPIHREQLPVMLALIARIEDRVGAAA